MAPTNNPHGWCLVETPSPHLTSETWGFCSSNCRDGGNPRLADQLMEVEITVLSEETCQDIQKAPYHKVDYIHSPGEV